MRRAIKEYRRAARNVILSSFGLPSKRGDTFIEFLIRKGNIVQCSYSDALQTRQEATMHLLLEALKTVKYDLPKNRRFVFHTGDRPPETAITPVLAFSALVGSKNIVAAPDFAFWNWPDVGISDYTAVTEQIAAAGEGEPEDQRLFWIGNPETNQVRARLVDISAEDKRIFAPTIAWLRSEGAEGRASDRRSDTRSSNYVSLPDHCRYKYLIDIEGVGFSGRLKFLFFTGRPLFLQDRPWREFYFDRIRPFEHYIPVARDLSALSERLDWAEAHPAECRRIAENAQAFAKRHLTRDAAIAHLRKTLVETFARRTA